MTNDSATGPDAPVLPEAAGQDGGRLLQLAEFLYDRAEYSKAINKAQQAARLFEMARDFHGVFDAREVMGKSHERLGQHAQALELQENNLKLSHDLGDERCTRKALLSLGILYYNQGDYVRSIESHSGSLTLAEAQQDTFGQGAALGNIGNAYERMGDYATALEHHLRCLELFSSAEFREQQSYALNNIGNVYTALHDYPAAIDYHRQSLQLKREAGDRWGEASSLYNLGSCHYRLDELPEAERLLRESLGIVTLIDDQEGLGLALLGLGQVAWRRAEHDTSRELYRQALAVFSGLGSRHNEAEVWWRLSETESASGNTPEAVAALNRAIKLAEVVNGRELLRQAHATLAEHYEQLEDFREATRQLRLAHGHERALYNEASQHRLQSLRIRFEVDRTSQEKELYRLRNVELAEAYDKLQELHSALQAANVRQQSLLARLETQRRLLERQSREDGLTGLYNRRFFDSAFRQEHARVQRSRRSLSVALCDIDDFKSVNDRYSHSVGDRTLKTLAGILQKSSRSSDVVARYGGEEFALLLPDTDNGSAGDFCERLRESIESYPWEQIQPGLRVTISAGVATDDGELDIDDLMRQADQRLYQAKNSGKNRVVTGDGR
jgi:diguanylate cyclase (GGDEF)-like protein